MKQNVTYREIYQGNIFIENKLLCKQAKIYENIYLGWLL